MLTSEAAIKAIIESVIQKSQSSPEPGKSATGPSENLSRTLCSNHTSTNDMKLEVTARGDMADEPYHSSLGVNNAETKANSDNAKKDTNKEEGAVGQICKDGENKTTIQVWFLKIFDCLSD